MTKIPPELTTGSIVMYENDSAAILAAVTQIKGAKILVVNDRSRENEIAESRIYTLVGSLPAGISTLPAIGEFLVKLRATADEIAKTIDLAELWALRDDTEPAKEQYDYELCHAYLGSIDLEKHVAFRLKLLNDRIFYKRHKFTFEARSAEVVEELQKAHAAKLQKLALQGDFCDWLRKRLTSPDLELSAELQSCLALLEDAAAQGDTLAAPKRKEAEELVVSTGLVPASASQHPLHERALALLEKCGHFHKDTNLALIRYRPPVKWSPEQLAAAEAVAAAAAEVDLGSRIDLRAAFTFTIDDETTKDMDDALSIERTRDGYRLGIHITDVAAVLDVESPLDASAKTRSTSLYFPDQTINMLPEVLSEDKLSLIVGADRATISAIFVLRDDFTVISEEIVLSTIRVDQRFGYTEVDSLLESEASQELQLLYNIASHQEAERIHNGATRVEKRDAAIIVGKDKTLKLVEIDEVSPSRALVGEMMVLYNCAIARLAINKNFAVPYRGQDKPEDSSIPKAPPGPAYDYTLRTRLKRSVVSLKPMYHATLGVDAYTQVSSPIRRYLDLCVQRQIINALKGMAPFYSPDQMLLLIEDTESALRRAVLLSREVKRYWLLRYLEELPRDRPITGTVIKNDVRNPIVELSEVYIPVIAKIPGKPKLGDQYTFKISAVKPRDDYLRLEVI